MTDHRNLYEIAAALITKMHETIHRAQAAGRITVVSEQVFLVTDPGLIAALRFYFEHELTFRGIDVLSTEKPVTPPDLRQVSHVTGSPPGAAAPTHCVHGVRLDYPCVDCRDEKWRSP